MIRMVTIEDYQRARKRHAAAEEWEQARGKACGQLEWLAAWLGALFAAWALRGLL